ncbi:sigma-70 family RNA polymerase sigma factor [bacterium]|nr:sigma-70 family RNA polymerase sigma factor [bacterium]
MADARWEEVISRAKEGEEWALEEIFVNFKNMVFNICYRMSGKREDAEDWTQETFLRAFSALKSFRGDSSLSTWLYRIAVNVCLSHLREKQPTSSLEEVDYKLGGDDEPEDDLSEEVQTVLSRMPPFYRTLLILRYFEDLSYNEISQIMKMPLSNVKIALHRARKKFKEIMEELEK